jgi:hypothetical protein
LTDILGPHSLARLVEEVGGRPYSLAIQFASYRGSHHALPVVVRFFSAREGIQCRLLELKFVKREEVAQEVFFLFIFFKFTVLFFKLFLNILFWLFVFDIFVKKKEFKMDKSDKIRQNYTKIDFIMFV